MSIDVIVGVLSVEISVIDSRASLVQIQKNVTGNGYKVKFDIPDTKQSYDLFLTRSDIEMIRKSKPGEIKKFFEMTYQGVVFKVKPADRRSTLVFKHKQGGQTSIKTSDFLQAIKKLDIAPWRPG